MTLYDVVAKLCEERKMPIRQLERNAIASSVASCFGHKK